MRRSLGALGIVLCTLSWGACAADPQGTHGDARPVDNAELAGGTWHPLPSYLPDAGRLEPSPATGAVTFETDGSWKGFDGCNREGGTYELSTGESTMIDLTGGVSTDIGCANFSPLEQLNGHTLSVTQAGTRLRVYDEDRLIVEYSR